jgi:hypothetical protein
VTVHLRRAILLFALVLGLTALAAAVSPTRETGPPAVTPPPSSTPPGTVLPRAVAFATRESGKPQVRRARVGEHIVITVASTEGGLVTIPRLGRTSSVSADAPARFDVLAPATGRYDVLLELGGGPNEPRRVGTLITRP